MNYNSGFFSITCEGKPPETYKTKTLKDRIEGIRHSQVSAMIINKGAIPDEVQNKAERIIAQVPPRLTGLCFASDFTAGAENLYLSSIISIKDIGSLEMGQAILINSPTGSGKTQFFISVIEAMRDEIQVIFLTNRSSCKVQLCKDILRHRGMKEIPEEWNNEDVLDKITNLDNNIMTYQKFVMHKHKYKGKKLLLIMDECHCFSEDATFSTYPQEMLNFIKGNRDNTIRIYASATMDDILEKICKIEALTDDKLLPITYDTDFQYLLQIAGKKVTRIHHVYTMCTNWNYLTFKVYDPAKRDMLIDYLKEEGEKGRKSLIFINDIVKGQAMQGALKECQHVFSDEAKKAELNQIAIEEKFHGMMLVTTKVAENGLSLHDDNLSIIVAETWDPVTLQQVIGRIRVSRKKPRNIEVLIPDYSLCDLGSIEGKVSILLQKFENAKIDLHWSMQCLPQPNPYVYYSAILKEPLFNSIGYQTLRKQLDFIRQLKDEEAQKKHAFVRYILGLYGKEPELCDSMLINYSAVADCNARIQAAWETYKTTAKGENELHQLKEALKSACKDTKAYDKKYGKKYDSNIHIDTVNDILSLAGITERILPERKVFDIVGSEE